jgi:hypothetical protein
MIKSTVTYLELATLQAVTGIAVQGAALDDDGAGTVAGECVSPEQIANIQALLTETNSTEESFLRVIKAESVASIKAAAYSTVCGILEAKRRHA